MVLSAAHTIVRSKTTPVRCTVIGSSGGIGSIAQSVLRSQTGSIVTGSVGPVDGSGAAASVAAGAAARSL